MYNYLELRKEELKKRGNKGFTLMEMLIVVAIIAVLIAIAIPVFTSQLENARDATSIANIRSAYAEAQTAYITKDSTSTHATYAGGTDGTATVTVSDVQVESQQNNEWSGQGDKLPFTKPADPGKPAKYEVTFSYDADGNISTAPTLAE